MTRAGADVIVAHMGVTTGGAIGATSAKSLDDCVAAIDAIADAARGEREDVIVLCHGGPIADARRRRLRPEARRAPATASTAPPSMERLPVERALTDQTRAFKAIGKA